MNTYNPYGLKIPLGAIGKLLGLVQDVSPKMAFELDYNAEVEIVIYSVQASVVATIFKGSKKPGYHTYTWNGRNDQGKKMPPGDYIGEIRIGNRKYIRKRIVIY
jgi:flagellar hook assembly protein FlgD